MLSQWVTLTFDLAFRSVQLNFGLSLYLDRKFGLNLSLSEITLLFDLSLDLDQTLPQRKAQRQAKSKVKVTHCLYPCNLIEVNSTITVCRNCHVLYLNGALLFIRQKSQRLPSCC